ncbi:hypothetical protein [Saccharopolyspora sp. ASAGF58]|uniref:hypothetical protein n=1 Tax=Saccharopolyspora sp. ASAGF58 TaxID=2719023 RepID=UPI0014472A0E|nr:hypothetical protein [Saccharopolyspora sp. ASAGF58]
MPLRLCDFGERFTMFLRGKGISNPSQCHHAARPSKRERRDQIIRQGCTGALSTRGA